jgi:beta-phosphoglucomutase-like phosphatase (HAD superfamily)
LLLAKAAASKSCSSIGVLSSFIPPSHAPASTMRIMAIQVLNQAFRALIFDCDGTLVETLPAHVAALQAALAHTHVRPSMAWAQSKYGLSPSTVLKAVEAELGKIETPHEDVLSDWAAGYLLHLDRVHEIQSICNIARAWHGKVPMAVASNGHRSTIEATLKAVAIAQLFDVVVSADDVQNAKPAPDVFLEAARRMGVPPAECVVFEDSEEGMEAARRAGMRVVFARG